VAVCGIRHGTEKICQRLFVFGQFCLSPNISHIRGGSKQLPSRKRARKKGGGNEGAEEGGGGHQQHTHRCSMRNTIDPCDHATHPLAAPEKLDTTETLDLELTRTGTRGRILVCERIESEGLLLLLLLQGRMWSVRRGWCGRRRSEEGRVGGELAQSGWRRRIRVVCCERIGLHGLEAE